MGWASLASLGLLGIKRSRKNVAREILHCLLLHHDLRDKRYSYVVVFVIVSETVGSLRVLLSPRSVELFAHLNPRKMAK